MSAKKQENRTNAAIITPIKTGRDYLNRPISWVGCVAKDEGITGSPITISELVNQIRTGTHREAVEKIRAEPDEKKQKILKEKGGAWLIAGRFAGRKDKDLAEPSGLVPLDADVNPDPASARRVLTESPHTLVCALSARGKDYFGIVLVSPIPRNPAEYKEACIQVAEHYGEEYVAQSQDNAARLRYYTYDPDAFLNPESVPFNWKPSRKIKENRQKQLAGGKIGEGGRYNYLIHKVGLLIRARLDPAIIHATAQTINEVNFSPPHPAEYIEENVNRWLTEFEPGPEESESAFLNRLGKIVATKEVAKVPAKPDRSYLDWVLGGGYNADELRALVLPPTVWVVPGILPEGTTLCAGKPKAGKSFFALNLAIAVATGGKALGNIDVEQGRVLYLVLEGSLVDLQKRVGTTLEDAVSCPDLQMHLEWEAAPKGIERLDAWLKHYPDTKLVIVDTLVNIQDDSGSKNDRYKADYKSVKQFAELCRKYPGLSILMIHHTSKRDKNDMDDPFDAISGTTGLIGAVDTGIILGKSAEGAELYLRGRTMADQQIALTFDPVLMTWVNRGDAENFKLTSTKLAVVNILEGLDLTETLKSKEIAERGKLDDAAVRVTLSRLVKQGIVVKKGYGQYAISPIRTMKPPAVADEYLPSDDESPF